MSAPASVEPIRHEYAASRRALRRDIQRSGRVIYQPPQQLGVADAADAHRILVSESGAVEPGRWRTERVPYLREIMDALTDPDVQRVVFMKSSQVGGTEVGMNWVLQTIGFDPAPMLVLYPTDEMLKLWSTTKLDPMIRASDVLRDRVIDVDGKRPDRRNTMKRKLFRGGSLIGLSAKSGAQLRATVSPRAWADEVDAMDAEVKGQGDPLELLERAQRTFLRVGLAKMLIVSTPANLDTSRIAREHARSDQRYYLVPCPQCNHLQRLYWQDPEHDNRYRLMFERTSDAEPRVVPGSVRYACRACDHLIEERWKLQMLDPSSGAHWQPSKPVSPVRGYHVWTAYSPFVTWEQVAQKWLDVHKIPSERKSFVNLWVGEPFREEIRGADPHVLRARAEDYGEGVEVPAGVGALTASIDVQGDRVEWTVWGWGIGEESWGIDYGTIDGDPSEPATFDAAGEAVMRPWRHASGATLVPAILAVDAGYLADHVWAFCERMRARGFTAVPCIGKAGRSRQIAQRPEIPKYRRTREQRRPTWTMGSDSTKDELIGSRFHVAAPGPRYVHVPQHFEAVWYEQVTAEKLTTKYVDKRPVLTWQVRTGRANDRLDQLCMCLFGVYALGPRFLAALPRFVEQLAHYKPAADPSKAPAAPAIKYGTLSDLDL